jgi:hypothetical protein
MQHIDSSPEGIIMSEATLDEVLKAEEKILGEIKALKSSIPGTGAAKLATEEYLKKKFDELKAPAADKPKEEDKPGLIEELLSWIFPEEVISHFKEVELSWTYLASTVGVVTGLLGITLIKWDEALNGLLGLGGKKLGSKYGIPWLENTNPEQSGTSPDSDSAGDASTVSRATDRANDVDALAQATERLNTALRSFDPSKLPSARHMKQAARAADQLGSSMHGLQGRVRELAQAAAGSA